jgi:hypothetical protein
MSSEVINKIASTKQNILTMTIKQSIATVMLVAATSVGSIWGYGQYQERKEAADASPVTDSLFKTAAYTESTTADPGVDFEKAASKAVPAVGTSQNGESNEGSEGNCMQNHPFRVFFGEAFEDMFGVEPNRQNRGGEDQVPASLFVGIGYFVTKHYVCRRRTQLQVILSNIKVIKEK